jgi:hypothetical protein
MATGHDRDVPVDGSGPAEARLQHVSEALAPFVAWLATQGLEEDARRRHRDAAERFLVWCLNDGGPVRGRRGRWLRHVRRHDPDHLDDATAGLGWWTDHRRLLARTLPYEG